MRVAQSFQPNPADLTEAPYPIFRVAGICRTRGTLPRRSGQSDSVGRWGMWRKWRTRRKWGNGRAPWFRPFTLPSLLFANASIEIPYLRTDPQLIVTLLSLVLPRTQQNPTQTYLFLTSNKKLARRLELRLPCFHRWHLH